MAAFMANDEAAVQALEEKLSKTLYRTADVFVEHFNAGTINRKHPDNVALATELTQTYRNLKEKNGQLIFIPQDEVILGEVLADLGPLLDALRLKRLLQDAVDSESLSPEDVFFLSPDKGNGTPLREEGDSLEVITDRTAVKRDVIEDLHRRLASAPEGVVKDDEGASRFHFRVLDFISLDTTFVENLRKVTPKF